MSRKGGGLNVGMGHRRDFGHSSDLRQSPELGRDVQFGTIAGVAEINEPSWTSRGWSLQYMRIANGAPSRCMSQWARLVDAAAVTQAGEDTRCSGPETEQACGAGVCQTGDTQLHRIRRCWV